MHRNLGNCLVIFTLVAAAATPLESAQAGKATVLYSFSGGSDGSVPAAGLIADKAGNFYGTTYAGGSSGFGAVFKLAPDGSEAVLHSFGGGSDGEYPQSGLVQDTQGNLYGTTFEGGSDSLGTVFRLAPDGTETVLHAFTGAPLTLGGPYDGAYPMGGLILNAKGNLYGTTEAGGAQNYGEVFEISASGQERALHSFAGSPDGAYPLATLMIDGTGYLFGTTLGGGVQSNYCGVGCGTVFEMSPKGRNSWSETVIYSFQGEGNDTTNPWADVIEDSAGNLFGTATLGGDYNDCDSGGCGAVFELSPAGKGLWNETMLYAFKGGSDGATPYAGLAEDGAGNLYGTTFESQRSANCSFYGCGTIFKLAADGKETVVHAFAGGAKDGANSSANLVADGKGNLYGTSQAGGRGGCNTEGQIGCGTVFRLKE